jgi:hypothetical protein
MIGTEELQNCKGILWGLNTEMKYFAGAHGDAVA